MELHTGFAKRFAACIIAATLLVTSCDSTAATNQALVPIAGHTFEVISIGGRPLPTTLGIMNSPASGPGNTAAPTELCGARPVARVMLEFSSDSSFRETTVNSAAQSLVIGGSYREDRVGQRAIISERDTAVVEDGILRVTLTGFNCGQEKLVALPR